MLTSAWHSQEAHKLYACVVMLDLAGIKDQKKRDEVLSAWQKTPSSLGANASAFGQLLGREKGAKATKEFKGGL